MCATADHAFIWERPFKPPGKWNSISHPQTERPQNNNFTAEISNLKNCIWPGKREHSWSKKWRRSTFTTYTAQRSPSNDVPLTPSRSSSGRWISMENTHFSIQQCYALSGERKPFSGPKQAEDYIKGKEQQCPQWSLVNEVQWISNLQTPIK